MFYFIEIYTKSAFTYLLHSTSIFNAVNHIVDYVPTISGVGISAWI
jgi:hypothetical protein